MSRSMTDYPTHSPKKKRLLLLGGGFEQLNALRIARELGAEVIVFDGHEDAPCSYEADIFRTVNIKNHQQLIKEAAAMDIDAVFVHAAELAIECAIVAEHFSLPGLSVETATFGTEKTARSICLSNAGVRIPKFAALAGGEHWEAWLRAAKHIGYPLIAKPTSLAGARGVQYVSNETELSSYFNSKSEFGEQGFQLEEYIQGAQLSTESVAIDGQLKVTSIAQRHYDTTADLWPFQIEDGHSMPWAGNREIRIQIDAVVEQCRAAFGMNDGVLKGDIVLTDTGDIVILEMAVRTSGGRFCDTVVPLSSGVNILYPLIQLALGLKPDMTYLQAKRHAGISQRFILLAAGTKLRQVKNLQASLLDPSVIGYWFREDIYNLEKAPEIRSHRDRLGYVICAGETQAEADEKARRLVEEIARALVAEKQA